MVEQGKISSEEEVRLLAALKASEGAEQSVPATAAHRGRQLRIHIMEGGQTRVNLNLSLRLAGWGLKWAEKYGGLSQGDAQEIL